MLPTLISPGSELFGNESGVELENPTADLEDDFLSMVKDQTKDRRLRQAQDEQLAEKVSPENQGKYFALRTSDNDTDQQMNGTARILLSRSNQTKSPLRCTSRLRCRRPKNLANQCPLKT